MTGYMRNECCTAQENSLTQAIKPALNCIITASPASASAP